MVLLGKSFTKNKDGEMIYTLYCSDSFPAYFSGGENGRGCEGKRVEQVYAGNYDCSGFKLGADIEVLYEKAVQTKNGIYSPIKRIDVIGGK